MKKTPRVDESAFPVTDRPMTYGMTLRDYAELKILQGLLGGNSVNIHAEYDLVIKSKKIANEWLKQREEES